MKAQTLFLATAAAVLILAIDFTVLPTPAAAASSDITDLDAKLSAKVARQRIKQRGARRGSRSGGNNADCGSVEIGNNDNRRGSRGRVNPRDTTIIVTGPIINAAKCR